MLLEAGTKVNQPCTPSGATALTLAVQRRHVPVAKLLLEKGANADHVDHVQRLSPLHIAARAKSLELVQLLLSFGADPLLSSSDGYTALCTAARVGSTAGCTAIIADVCGCEESAVESGQLQAAQQARLTTLLPNPCQPVVLASGEGHELALKLLLQCGLPAKMPGLWQQPLHVAAV